MGFSQMCSKVHIAHARGDSHGRLECLHGVQGPTIYTFSSDTFVNGINCIRKSDMGKHAQCCDANKYGWITGSENVFINQKAVVRSVRDQSFHCGKVKGRIFDGSPNVTVNVA